jgi:hypothetical protein
LTRRDRKPRVAWLSALLFVLAFLALPVGAEAAGPGGISGTVTFEGGAAGKAVAVCALAEEVKVRCATAGTDGDYEITGLAEGEYVVEFLTSGEADYVWEYYNHTRIYEAATPVAVTAEAVQGGIDAVLEEGATISGEVTATTTRLGVGGVKVCAREAAAESRFEPCVETSLTGGYTIAGLPPGEFDIYFFPEGTRLGLLAEAYDGRGVGAMPNAISVQPKENRDGIDASLDPGGQIFGTVRSAATRAPLGGVEVCLSEAATLRRLTCLVTPVGGGYRFIGLWSDSYKVVFSPGLADIYGPGAVPTEAQLPAAEWVAFHDGFPTQWFDRQSSFAAATPIALTAPETIVGIDDLVGTAPAPAVTAPVTPPATAVAKKKRKPLKCRRAFVRRKVHGKPRCVRRHKPARRHHRHPESR